ncbi:LysR family transcriptional regulator [Brenneria populi]|uniref:LysR family transcriptional regulator n=1 Tax=Brenneria populi TaxID=1505588 RepID=A0ABU6JKP3_9GAMM|nr:LysR family transcriptional regulator [Brenneria populi Li et al. 2015]
MERLRMPPLYALKAFEAASRHLSFTQAANELSITQSAISKHIHTLESFFGRRLFKRMGPKVILTHEGECFAKEIQPIFTSLCVACKNFSSESDKLHIKAPITFSLRWLIAILNKFHSEKKHPRVKIDNNSINSNVVDFNIDSYDGAIQFGKGDFPGVSGATRLLDEWLIPVCSPDFLSKKDIKNTGVDLLYSIFQENNWFNWCEKAHREERVKIVNRYEFYTIESAISAAVQGFGIATVDINMVRREIENGTLVFPFNVVVRTGYAYYFVWPEKSANNRSISLLNDYIKKSLIEWQAEGVKYIG